jgi:proteic killer suppression protein
MILGFRDNWLAEFFVAGRVSKRIPADLRDRLFRKLQMLDDAAGDADLWSPPGNHFERLSGHLKGWHSIRVNQQWRLIFRWSGDGGKAGDIYLDNHDYR